MTDIKREDVKSAILDAHESSFACAECAFLGPCRRCRTLEMVIALGAQWIEARRARWETISSDERQMTGGDGRNLGVTYEFDDKWQARFGEERNALATLASAQEWVEARAVADGYEIAREP